MEDFAKLLGETETKERELNNVNRESASCPSSQLQRLQWCSSCLRQAENMEEKYSRNFVAVKQKIFFTDNLIQLYQITKKQLGEVTEQCNRISNDKILVQAQLELLLSKDQPSYSENEKLQTTTKILEEKVEELKTQLHAMDKSRRIHEETIQVLKAEDAGPVHELKRKHAQQITELKKFLAEKREENKKLSKRNQELQRRIERLINGKKRQKSGTGKHLDENANQTCSAIEMTKDANTTDAIISSGITSSDEGNVSYPLDRQLVNTDINLEEITQSFTMNPTEPQLCDLLAIATEWKVLLVQRPGPRKKILMDSLLTNVSEFCVKHEIKSRHDALSKLYELHKNLFAKRYQQWLEDLLNSTDAAIEKSSKSLQDDHAGNIAPSGGSEVVRHEHDASAGQPVDIVAPDSDPKVKKDDKEVYSTSHTEKDEDFISEMPDISDATAVTVKHSGTEREQICSKLSLVRKHKISGEARHANVKKRQKIEGIEIPTTDLFPKRQTRSVVSSLSDHDDFVTSSPMRRSLRISSRHSSSEPSESKFVERASKSMQLKQRKSPKEIKRRMGSKTDQIPGPISEIANDEVDSLSEINIFSEPVSVARLQHERPVEEANFENQQSTSRVSVHVDSPAESAGIDMSHDLLDIFNEMLPLDRNRLSPLAKSPSSEADAGGGAEAMAETSLPETNDISQDDDSVMLSSGNTGRNSISPSTILCTALSFATPMIAETHTEKNVFETDTIGPDSDGSARVGQDSYDDNLTESEQLRKSLDGGSLLLSSTSAAKDILKPRRFSCEAPEKAVNVPPIKPVPAGSPLEHIQSPLFGMNNNPVKSKNFPPHRKDNDVPSHWQQSGSHATGDQTFNNREFCSSDGEEHSDLVNVSASSDYDTDKALNDMAGSCSLLSAIDSESDIGNAVNSETTIASQKVTKKVLVSAVSVGSSNKTGVNENLTLEKNMSWSANMSAEDGSLIMDFSDDQETEHDMEMVVQTDFSKTPSKPEIKTTKGVQNNKASSPKIDQSDITETDHSEQPLIVKTAKDFKTFISKGMRKKPRKIVVRDSFIVEGVAKIFKKSVVVFDGDGEDYEQYTMENLPACEQMFLRQIHLLHSCGAVGTNFLTCKLIPLLMKIQERLTTSYMNKASLEKNIKDDFYSPFLSFLSHEKHNCGISLARMNALSRVLILSCKMADTFIPVYHVCRHHLLWSKAANSVISLAQGLLYWPKGLTRYTVLGKTVLRVLHKFIASSQVFGQRLKAAIVEQQVNWISVRCHWQTSSLHESGSHKMSIDDAISKIKEAGLSMELEAFLGQEKKGTVDCIQKIPVFNQDAIIGILSLELLSKEMVVDEMKVEVLDKQFWSLLNLWSQHIHIHGDVDKDRKVSNMCMMAILDSFSQILSSYLLQQRHEHKDQPTTPKLQHHYATMCALMNNLSTLYLRKAPRIVQCSTAAFLLRTCFCNPNLAHASLLKWAKATMLPEISPRCKNHQSLALVAVLARCDEIALRRICLWLDRLCCPTRPDDTLVKCFWLD